MKRVLGIVLMISLTVSLFAGVPAFADGSGLSKADGYTEPDIAGLVNGDVTYTAFERFSASLTENGSPAYAWGKDGALVWRPYISNEEGTLTLLQAVQFEQFVNGTTNDAAIAGGVAMMHPDRFTANPGEYISVVFTAKEAGTVRITDTMNYSSGNAANPLDIRIRKVSNGTSTVMVSGELAFGESEDVSICATVAVGDMICFEAANAGTPVSGYATSLYLNPQITYLVEGGLEKNPAYTEPNVEGLVSGGISYTAFERFSASLTENGSPAYAWGKDGALVWRPYISNEEGALTLLQTVQFEQFVNGTTSDAAIAGGAAMMHPDRFTANLGEYISLVFTAKEAGTVRITDTMNYSSGNVVNPLNIRIRKVSNGTSTVMVSGTVGFGESEDVDVSATVAVGDMICFEAANAGTPVSGYATSLYLNPQITYLVEGGLNVDASYSEPDITDLLEGAAFTAFERFSTNLTENGSPVYAWGNDGALVWKPYLSNEQGDLTLLTSISYGQFTNGTSSNAAVGSGMLHPDRTAVNPGEYAGMAFVANKSGIIRIADTLKYSVGNANNAFDVRIRKVSGSTSTPMISGKLTVGAETDILICAEVLVGDMICFEVANTTGTHESHKLELNPTITYMVDTPTYTSSSAFNLDVNGDGIWSWEYYDVASGKYKRLENPYGNYEGAWEPEYSNKSYRGRAWGADGATSVQAAAGYTLYSGVAAVGKYTVLHPPTNNDTYGVKSFTAPKSGKVTILHNGNPYAMQGTYGAANYLQQTAAKIIKISVDGTETQIWPVDVSDKPAMKKSWKAIGTYGGAANPDKTTGYTFTESDLQALKDIDLTMGDQLKFVASRQDPYNASPGIVWDPVVAYTEMHPMVQSASIERFETNVPPAKDLVLTFNKKLKEAISVNDIIVKTIVEGVDSETDAVCQSVVFGTDIEGNTVLTLKFDRIKVNTEYGVYINGIEALDGESSTRLKWIFKTGEMFITYQPVYNTVTNYLTVDMYNSGAAAEVVLMVLVDGNSYFYRKSGVIKDDNITVDIGEVSAGKTIKAVLIDSLSSFRPRSDIMTLEVE